MLETDEPECGFSFDRQGPMEKISGLPPCPYKILDDKVTIRGRWLGYREVGFIDPQTGKEGVWQCAFRTTKPADSPVDGVDIIPILVSPSGEKSFVFVKQWRIPTDGWTLEFPAGLVDGGEKCEVAARRELKEETGYTMGRLLMKPTEGKQMLNPGMANDSIRIVVAEIDGNLPENQNPQQDLKEGEVIDVVVVPVADALSHLEEATKQGIFVEAIVYSFVLGFQLKGLI